MEYDFSKVNNLIANMVIGNEEAILLGLKHKGVLIRINGIIYSVKYKIKNEHITKVIQELKNDDFWYDGYLVSQFAIAGLHIMNIEPYTGNDERILELIESKFEF